MLKHPDRKKWGKWLDRIMDEMLASATDHYVFERWRDVIRGNQAIDFNNRFVGLIWGSYMDRQALLIRRQLDRDRQAISLARLMEEIAHYAPQLTRADFLNAYTRPEYTEAWQQGERFFDLFVDPAAPQMVSAEVVRQHLHELETASTEFLVLAGKWLAHSDGARSWPTLTFDNLNACLTLWYRRWEQYREFVNRSPVDADIPQLTGTEWESVLDIPWRASGGGGEVQ